MGPGSLRLEVNPGGQQPEQGFGRQAAATPRLAMALL